MAEELTSCVSERSREMATSVSILDGLAGLPRALSFGVDGPGVDIGKPNGDGTVDLEVPPRRRRVCA